MNEELSNEKAAQADPGAELKELRLQLKKLKRANSRLEIECETLRKMNAQVSRAQSYIQKENQRQTCYNNQLLKVSPHLLVMVDEKLETVMASEIFSHVTEIGPDAVRDGMPLRQAFSRVLGEGELSLLLEKCKSALENKGAETYLLNTQMEGEDKIFKVDISYYAAENEDAKGLCILFTDMTEVMEAKERAESADKAKSNFLANMSHEIRTPMNAINGMAGFILRDSQDEEAKKNAALIKSAAKSLISIINDILDFSKIESGKMEIINETYSLSSLINDVITMIRFRLVDKKVGLSVNLSPETPESLFGDEVRVKQILINLLNNAVKFTNEGEITLTVGYHWESQNSCRLFVSVADTGIGIKKEELSQIFDSFTQVDTKRNRSIEGTGLGLAISRRLVEMMGGHLSVESEYGKGSVFSFDIVNQVRDWTPVGILSERLEMLQTTFEETSLSMPSARILVVDDNDMNLKVAKGILKPFDILPDCATSGAECLQLLQKRCYDLVFMDHMMPVMDGVEAMHRIHDLMGEKSPKIVVLTANALSGVDNKYLSEGFDGYLAKPIESSAMEALLRKILPEKVEGQSSLSKEDEDEAKKIRPGEEVNSEGEALDAPQESPVPSLGAQDTNAPENSSQKEMPPKQEMPAKQETLPMQESSPTEEDFMEGADPIARLKLLGLDTDTGLLYAASDPDFYLEIVGDFVADREENTEKLQALFEAKDWKNYEVSVHSLKGNAKTIGAFDFSEIPKSLEFAAKEGNITFIESHHGPLLEAYHTLTQRIGRALQKEGL